jgi:hypothetical protein
LDAKNIEFSMDDNFKLCNEWFEHYTISNAMIYASSVLIVVVNVIIKSILKFISTFEGKHTKTEVMSTNTYKMFLIQFINTVFLSPLK